MAFPRWVARSWVFRLICRVAIYLAVFYLFAVGCLFFALDYGTRVSPAKMYELTFGTPPPATVSELQGFGRGHSGYTFHLRFRVPTSEIPQFLHSPQMGGWKLGTWAEVGREFHLEPKDGQRFKPPWSPEAIPNKECYWRGEPGEYSGFRYGDFLLIERSTGIVYFSGHGP